jgi:hypothetical protein
MAKPTDSFKQFDYSLRPSKQVERKIMIEVLLRLSAAGYPIRDYRCLGFGSPYYVDFVMFHKFLFINDMVCIEWANIPKRMTFNKPFRFIRLKMGALSSHIPSMPTKTRHLLWLDYDRSLDREILQDIDGCLNRMAPKSVLIVTIDARPRLPRDEFEFNIQAMKADEREKLTVRTYQEWFGVYSGTQITQAMISGLHVAPLFYAIAVERVRQTLTTRRGDLRFIQLFNYVYRDGAPMLTVGGMIGTDDDERILRKAKVLDDPFVCSNSEYLEISVPPLTVREKHWLESRLDKKLTAAKLRFELGDDLLNNYRKFYKEYPTYMETVL